MNQVFYLKKSIFDKVKKEFQTKVGKLEDSRVYMYHIIVPAEVVTFFKDKKQRRLLCKVNDMDAYASAILTLKDGYAYINLNKERLKQGKFKVGSKVNVILEADTSEYGMPMPAELQEIFEQDIEVNAYFHKLTPGVQRTLLYMIGKIKTEGKRIEKAVIMTNYLKQVQGSFNFKELNEAFKKGL